MGCIFSGFLLQKVMLHFISWRRTAWYMPLLELLVIGPIYALEQSSVRMAGALEDVDYMCPGASSLISSDRSYIHRTYS